MAKKALGRGLNAIFEDVEQSYNKELEHSGSKQDIVQELDVDGILPNPYQPRVNFDDKSLKELALSIKSHGLLQPIIVYQKDGEYVLLAGERRLRASKIAKIKKIRAIVADIKSKNLRELALIENIQRQDLNPIELANSYKELIEEYKITQEALSDVIHKSRTQITNTLRLLLLSSYTQEFIGSGKISQGHAKVLVGLEKEIEKTVVDTIIGQKLSVRETENLVKNLKSNPKLPKKEKKEFAQLKNVRNILQELNFPVKIKNNSIVMDFKSENQLEEFIKFISNVK